MLARCQNVAHIALVCEAGHSMLSFADTIDYSYVDAHLMLKTLYQVTETQTDYHKLYYCDIVL